MLLALILTAAVLPAAGILAQIARMDLAAALDDYHRVKAEYAARASVALVEVDLQRGGTGQITWPGPDTTLEVTVQELPDSWTVRIAAQCGRATAEATAEIPRPGDEGGG
jgi:hypothetical protein